MSDFVVNFDLLGGLSVDEWWEEMDRKEKKDQKQRRHAEINEGEIEDMEKSRNEISTHKQTMWSVCCFESWFAKKRMVIDFKTVTKTDLNQALRQFYASVKNGKGEPYTFSILVYAQGLTGTLMIRRLADPGA